MSVEFEDAQQNNEPFRRAKPVEVPTGRMVRWLKNMSGVSEQAATYVLIGLALFFFGLSIVLFVLS